MQYFKDKKAALKDESAVTGFNRRQFLSLLAGLALTPVFSSCTSQNKQINIAAHTWPGYEPLFMAKNEGWLYESKVRLHETQSATESIQALASNKVDGAALTLDEMLRARAMGIPLTAVLVFDISAGADMLLVRDGINKIADLKGKRIGVENGGVGALMFNESMRAGNLNPSNVNLISLTIDQQLQAWEDGALDAVITYEPVSTKLMAMGANRLYDSRMIPDTIVDVLAVQTAKIDDSYAESIQHCLNAHIKALNHISTNPQDAAYRIAPHLKLKPEQVLPSFRGLVLPNLENNLRLLAGNEPQLLNGARKVSKMIAQLGLIAQEDQLTDLIYGGYLENIDAS